MLLAEGSVLLNTSTKKGFPGIYAYHEEQLREERNAQQARTIFACCDCPQGPAVFAQAFYKSGSLSQRPSSKLPTVTATLERSHTGTHCETCKQNFTKFLEEPAVTRDPGLILKLSECFTGSFPIVGTTLQNAAVEPRYQRVYRVGLLRDSNPAAGTANLASKEDVEKWLAENASKLAGDQIERLKTLRFDDVPKAARVTLGSVVNAVAKWVLSPENTRPPKPRHQIIPQSPEFGVAESLRPWAIAVQATPELIYCSNFTRPCLAHVEGSGLLEAAMYAPPFSVHLPRLVFAPAGKVVPLAKATARTKGWITDKQVANAVTESTVPLTVLVQLIRNQHLEDNGGAAGRCKRNEVETILQKLLLGNKAEMESFIVKNHIDITLLVRDVNRDMDMCTECGQTADNTVVVCSKCVHCSCAPCMGVPSFEDVSDDWRCRFCEEHYKARTAGNKRGRADRSRDGRPASRLRLRAAADAGGSGGAGPSTRPARAPDSQGDAGDLGADGQPADLAGVARAAGHEAARPGACSVGGSSGAANGTTVNALPDADTSNADACAAGPSGSQNGGLHGTKQRACHEQRDRLGRDTVSAKQMSLGTSDTGLATAAELAAMVPAKAPMVTPPAAAGRVMGPTRHRAARTAAMFALEATATPSSGDDVALPGDRRKTRRTPVKRAPAFSVAPLSAAVGGVEVVAAADDTSGIVDAGEKKTKKRRVAAGDTGSGDGAAGVMVTAGASGGGGGAAVEAGASDSGRGGAEEAAAAASGSRAAAVADGNGGGGGAAVEAVAVDDSGSGGVTEDTAAAADSDSGSGVAAVKTEAAADGSGSGDVAAVKTEAAADGSGSGGAQATEAASAAAGSGECGGGAAETVVATADKGSGRVAEDAATAAGNGRGGGASAETGAAAADSGGGMPSGSQSQGDMRQAQYMQAVHVQHHAAAAAAAAQAQQQQQQQQQQQVVAAQLARMTSGAQTQAAAVAAAAVAQRGVAVRPPHLPNGVSHQPQQQQQQPPQPQHRGRPGTAPGVAMPGAVPPQQPRLQQPGVATPAGALPYPYGASQQHHPVPQQPQQQQPIMAAPGGPPAVATRVGGQQLGVPGMQAAVGPSGVPQPLPASTPNSAHVTQGGMPPPTQAAAAGAPTTVTAAAAAGGGMTPPQGNAPTPPVAGAPAGSAETSPALNEEYWRLVNGIRAHISIVQHNIERYTRLAAQPSADVKALRSRRILIDAYKRCTVDRASPEYTATYPINANAVKLLNALLGSLETSLRQQPGAPPQGPCAAAVAAAAPAADSAAGAAAAAVPAPAQPAPDGGRTGQVGVVQQHQQQHHQGQQQTAGVPEDTAAAAGSDSGGGVAAVATEAAADGSDRGGAQATEAAAAAGCSGECGGGAAETVVAPADKGSGRVAEGAATAAGNGRGGGASAETGAAAADSGGGGVAGVAAAAAGNGSSGGGASAEAVAATADSGGGRVVEGAAAAAGNGSSGGGASAEAVVVTANSGGGRSVGGAAAVAGSGSGGSQAGEAAVESDSSGRCAGGAVETAAAAANSSGGMVAEDAATAGESGSGGGVAEDPLSAPQAAGAGAAGGSGEPQVGGTRRTHGSDRISKGDAACLFLGFLDRCTDSSGPGPDVPPDQAAQWGELFDYSLEHWDSSEKIRGAVTNIVNTLQRCPNMFVTLMSLLMRVCNEHKMEAAGSSQ